MSQPDRDWIDAREKVDAAGRCRVCGLDLAALAALGRSLEAAHTVGRTHDSRLIWRYPDGKKAFVREHVQGGQVRLWVDPDDIVELCGPATSTDTCHGAYDGHRLDLLPLLTVDEQIAAVRAAGGIASAIRRLTGGRTVDEQLDQREPRPPGDEALIPF